MEFAKAYPRKHFFIEMFTRDISFEDCILDLIDNSIDALIVTRNLDIASESFTRNKPVSSRKQSKLPLIEVTYSPDAVEVKDNCGGIEYDLALNEVFNFGRSRERSPSTLGVYGIGLKRAIFKIGKRFKMKSRTTKKGFKVDLDLDKWAESDDKLSDWEIPISPIARAKSKKLTGTTIRITDLHPSIRMILKEDMIGRILFSAISQTYAFFLNRHVRIELNGEAVPSFVPEFGQSEQIDMTQDTFTDDQVEIRILVGLADRPEGKWVAAKSGWYVLCNGRVVVLADKDELTGWGVGLPTWQPKYRGFLGLAFFTSENPYNLPWTTTKRDLNREMPVYRRALNRMISLSRPVTRFLDSFYQGELRIAQRDRAIVEDIKPLSVHDIDASETSRFSVKRKKSTKKTTQKITYDAERTDIERIKKRLRKPKITLEKIGLHTYNYFLDKECPK